MVKYFASDVASGSRSLQSGSARLCISRRKLSDPVKAYEKIVFVGKLGDQIRVTPAPGHLATVERTRHEHLQPMTWTKGDLGRFQSEDKHRPRFEFLGGTPDRQRAVIWYGGDSKPTAIAIDTLRKSCVSWWEITIVPPSTPSWIKSGANFVIQDHMASKVTQAIIKGSNFQSENHVLNVNVQGHVLTIRRRQFNYLSCLDMDTKVLVMVPIPLVIEFGQQYRSFWDRVDDTSIFNFDEI